jgi:protein translocase SecG subunit
MDIIATILILVAVLASILLILVVLIQPGKSEMISGMGGLGGQINHMFGVRTGRNFLQNLTIGLAGGIILIAITVNKLFVSTVVEETGPVTSGRAIPENTYPAPAPAPAPSNPQQGQPSNQQPGQ